MQLQFLTCSKYGMQHSLCAFLRKSSFYYFKVKNQDEILLKKQCYGIIKIMLKLGKFFSTVLAFKEISTNIAVIPMSCQFGDTDGADPELKSMKENLLSCKILKKNENPTPQTSNQVNFSALDLLNETHHMVCLDIL